MSKADFIKKNILLFYVIYPLAAKLSPFLAKTRVTPTHITLLWLSIMTIALGLAYTGGSAFVTLNLFFLAYFFDCVDGQYARDSGLASNLGKFLDDFGGDVFNVFFWLSLGVIASDSSPMNLSVELSIFLCFTILFRSALTIRTNEVISTHNAQKPLKTSSYYQSPSFQRIILMPLRYGELLWPITLTAYMIDGLFWLIVFNSVYSVAVLIITLNKSIRLIISD
jgi:phosphatidylglycerophosphate synthase